MNNREKRLNFFPNTKTTEADSDGEKTKSRATRKTTPLNSFYFFLFLIFLFN